MLNRKRLGLYLSLGSLVFGGSVSMLACSSDDPATATPTGGSAGASGTGGAAGSGGSAGSAGSTPTPCTPTGGFECGPQGEVRECQGDGSWKTIQQCKLQTCNAEKGDCSKPEVCPMGKANCNQDTSDECEISIADDVQNCGECGKECSNQNVAAASCSNGACTPTCNAGFGDCTQPGQGQPDDGCETALHSDPKNCGACGNDCLGGACIAGVCHATKFVAPLTQPGRVFAQGDKVAWDTANALEMIQRDGQSRRQLEVLKPRRIQAFTFTDLGFAWARGALSDVQGSDAEQKHTLIPTLDTTKLVTAGSTGAHTAGFVHTLRLRGSRLQLWARGGLFEKPVSDKTEPLLRLSTDASCALGEHGSKLIRKDCDAPVANLTLVNVDGSGMPQTIGKTFAGAGPLALGESVVYAAGTGGQLEKVSLSDGSRIAMGTNLPSFAKEIPAMALYGSDLYVARGDVVVFKQGSTTGEVVYASSTKSVAGIALVDNELYISDTNADPAAVGKTGAIMRLVLPPKGK